MKRKIIFIMLSIFVSLSLLSPSYALSVIDETNFSQDAQGTTSLLGEFSDESSQVANPTLQYCPHGIICEFDDETMTLTNAYEGNRIEDVIIDVESFDEQHSVEILYNNHVVTEGELQKGMKIRIYHDDTLYGEYLINDLKTLTTSENIMPFSTNANTNTNSNGWVLPVANVNLDLSTAYGGTNPNGCISCLYSSSHEAIDFYRYLDSNGNAYGNGGRSIYSVKSGTVSWVQKWDGVTITGNQSYGHCILIDHNDGTKTRYAHMQSQPAFTVNTSITQGQIVGKVGTSGNSSGPHLHFEVYVGVSRVNPITYLTGAPTYGGSTHYHNYQYFYEGNHPHREYMECSCGDVY